MTRIPSGWSVLSFSLAFVTSKLQVSVAFAHFQWPNTRALNILVLRTLSFALSTSTALEVFGWSEWAAFLDSQQFYPVKENSMSRVFRFGKQSFSDSDCHNFARNAFQHSRTSVQAGFSAGVANNSVHELLERFESTLHCKNATLFSYEGKKYFAEFSKTLPGKGATIHCNDKKNTPQLKFSSPSLAALFCFWAKRNELTCLFYTLFWNRVQNRWRNSDVFHV